MIILKPGMLLNLYGNIYKIKRVRPNGKITMQYKGEVPTVKQSKPENKALEETKQP